MDLLPPKGRGAKAEINLAIVSDSLPLGTPSLDGKAESARDCRSGLDHFQKLTREVSFARSTVRITATAEEGI